MTTRKNINGGSDMNAGNSSNQEENENYHNGTSIAITTRQRLPDALKVEKTKMLKVLER